jgi:hypothetical protein
MRDPNRIPALLSALEQVWRQHPDLRLGQLVYILIHNDEGVTPGRLFGVEDEELMKLLDRNALKQ